ncbi:DUF3526 domain-containing protein [Alteromonas sp. KUL49]|uniref:DUF3526 domain-containing protein n=1 Tax=Alteromonas sp. KUL49 TaxID=2480798 RepID=UPI00102F1E18|nr:DUF3526 domain-containing protein [Alteromonas sp. KUL49]TAP42103.1 DUF3526 domain-containing protein [Alteromonas sp. KUL49]GEA09685.1 ABC transporter permease [Alteromonas sp. KUL49]
MSYFKDIKREAGFIAKQKYRVAFIFAAFLLSVFAVWSGITETQTQQETIERLIAKDHTDRVNVQSHQSDFGSAAYYTFHLTYDEPSPVAFAAMGQRDVYPWKHRVRMLALEGQIYETDADNPELSLVGRFDYAFLISVLMPLFVILLLHDLRSGEREAGRYDLLTVTTSNQKALWLIRAVVQSAALGSAIVIPFVIGAIVNGASALNIALIVGITIAHLALWTAIAYAVSGFKQFASMNSARIASSLLGIWLLITVVIPVAGDNIIKSAVQSPSGGEIVLTQREAVNGAWDLPFSATWDGFLATHPQWADKTEMSSLFEWKWYYAFQQVGDQTAAPLSSSYRDAIKQRDKLASYIAWMSPPMLTQRVMTAIANTNTEAMMTYEAKIREYHADLRQFYYPLLFNDVEFSVDVLEDLPRYTTNSDEAKHTQQ